MQVIRVPLVKAESAKRFLQKRNLLNHDYRMEKHGPYFYFAVTDREQALTLDYAKKSDKKLHKRMKRKGNLKYQLKDSLNEEELTLLRNSFDTVGDIGITEIPSALKEKEKKIGNALLDIQPNLKVVLKKAGVHTGVFRTQKLQWIAGEKRKETTHRESGCRLMLNVENVYFSPRSSNERLRIAKQVKEGEEILVMFSGCGVYPLVLAKNSPAKSIVGIELNPVAHEYAKKNKMLNKAEKVTFIEGDVREILPTKFKEKQFDRIIMPLPKGAEDFLALVTTHVKKGTTIHLYDFLKTEEIEGTPKEKIDKHLTTHKYTIPKTVLCGQFGPDIHRVCTDILIR